MKNEILQSINLRCILVLILLFFFLHSTSILVAQSDSSAVDLDLFDLLDMDLQDVLDAQVTSASKKAQSISDAPASIYVITKEDLLFYGSNNIGEALRMVPGIEIMQNGDQSYEVSARGLSRTTYNTSNKMLWLVNGRSVYNDAMGGIRLQSLPFAIDDIERIEVIRGPVSALYGANAFAGTINIILKNIEDQIGFFAQCSYGNLNQTNSSIRFGGKYGKFSIKATAGIDYMEQKQERLSNFSEGVRDSLLNIGHVVGEKTNYRAIYGNIETQYNINEKSSISLNGGYSDNMADHYFVIPGDMKFHDYFLKADYKDAKNTFCIYFNGQIKNDGYEISQFMKTVYPHENPYLASFNRTQYDITESAHTYNQMIDVGYNRNLQFGDKFSSIVGVSYRKNLIEANIFSPDAVTRSYDEDLYAGFVQLEYKPIEKLSLIAGGRYDYHTLVGGNLSYRIASLFHLTENQTIRLSYGTATKNPVFFDLYLNSCLRVADLKQITGGLDPTNNLTSGSEYVRYKVNGNTDLKAEQLLSWELGYQVNLTNKLQLKIDLFYNKMKNPIVYSASVVTKYVENIENINKINPNIVADLSALSPLNGGVDPTVPNSLSADEMQIKIAEINGIIETLTDMNDPNQNVATLLELVGGLTQLSKIPLEQSTVSQNSDKEYSFYGGEFSFIYIPAKNITLSGNYAYLKCSKEFNSFRLQDGSTEIEAIKSPEHKFNLAIKFKNKGFYSGLMLNYMSKITSLCDSDYDGMFDKDDLEFDNKGFFTIDPRFNLTVNLGYKFKKIDVFFTGYNLIQDEFLQLAPLASSISGDLLNRRFIGGIRLHF